MKSLPGFEQYVIARLDTSLDATVYFCGWKIGSYGRDIPHFKLDKSKAKIFASREEAAHIRDKFGDRYWIEEY